MNQNKIFNIAMIALGCATILFGGGTLAARYRANQQTAIINKLDKQQMTAQKAYQAKYAQLEEQADKQLAKHGNASERALAQNNRAYIKLKKASSVFFNAYYNWQTTSQFNSRSTQVSKVATPSVTSDSALFTKDAQKTVDALGLESAYSSSTARVVNVDGDNVTGLVTAHYGQGYNGNNANGTAAYAVTYNQELDRFTQMQLLQQSVDNNDF